MWPMWSGDLYLHSTFRRRSGDPDAGWWGGSRMTHEVWWDRHKATNLLNVTFLSFPLSWSSSADEVGGLTNSSGGICTSTCLHLQSFSRTHKKEYGEEDESGSWSTQENTSRIRWCQHSWRQSKNKMLHMGSLSLNITPFIGDTCSCLWLWWKYFLFLFVLGGRKLSFFLCPEPLDAKCFKPRLELLLVAQPVSLSIVVMATTSQEPGG